MRKRKQMNTFIIVLSVLIMIMFILFFIYIYINSESETSLELFSKVLIALLAAFIIIAFDILKPVKPVTKSVQIIILRNKENRNMQEFSDRLLKTSYSFIKYSTLYDVDIYSKKKELNKSYKAPYEVEDLDLVETAFWCWLSKKYTIHWDTKERIVEGISGGGGSISQKEDAEASPKILTIEFMKGLLQHNNFELDRGIFSQVAIPSGTDVKLILNTESQRSYTFSNRYLELNIKMEYVGSTGVEFTILGNKILESLKKSSRNQEYYTNNFIIEFSCKYSKWYKGNSELRKQMSWINALTSDFYENFDWSQIRPKLEKAYGIN
ncbi:MAG: hypothetical protein ACYC4T_09270 [Melioribacteraceae bacterium]